MKRTCPLAVALCLLLSLQWGEARDLHATYVTPAEIMLQRVLPPPPVPGSIEAKTDLAAVEAAVKARTPADEQRIIAQRPCTALAFAGDIMGPGFTKERVPLTLSLVERAFEDTELAILAAKKVIDRTRAYTLEPDLATFGHRSASTAYPSGHAACGRLMAVILAAMVPAKSRALYARAELYGRNRLMAGTHFPSELRAGATAGAIVADALFRNKKFKVDFAAAAIETREALGPAR